MADARALLRAKRQEAHIDHPLASYSASGQLRCLACGTAVKHATAWEGHIGSKAHRTAAARLREQRAREEQERERERESLKRKAAEVEDADQAADGGADQGDEPEGHAAPGGNAHGRRGGAELHAKKARVAAESAAAGGPPSPTPADALPRPAAARAALPADFFSDPSQAPPPPDEDEDDGDGDANANAGATGDALDAEWAQFQASVVNAPGLDAPEADVRETYERATVFAEPVLAPEVPRGFPVSAVAGEGEQAEGEGEEEEELDEEALRRKKEREDRELIMDRLLEEEQAQEEADARVAQLKAKLDALKKRREAARAAKGGAHKAAS
ncbi:hypothetical protein BD413DRAFT_603019 [Trametes elegans]|nr:hypothetical protein BD413DRAFT_603019 [Trametes elegans]